MFVVLRSNPSSWPGENGRGVEIPKEEEQLKNEKFKLNQFNLLASDRIALNRSISDVRLDGYETNSAQNEIVSFFLTSLFFLFE